MLIREQFQLQFSTNIVQFEQLFPFSYLLVTASYPPERHHRFDRSLQSCLHRHQWHHHRRQRHPDCSSTGRAVPGVYPLRWTCFAADDALVDGRCSSGICIMLHTPFNKKGTKCCKQTPFGFISCTPAHSSYFPSPATLLYQKQLHNFIAPLVHSLLASFLCAFSIHFQYFTL